MAVPESFFANATRVVQTRQKHAGPEVMTTIGSDIKIKIRTYCGPKWEKTGKN
jgi:hypothetical protein